MIKITDRKPVKIGDKEKAYILNNYQDYSNNKLGSIFGCSADTVARQIRKLRLKRTKMDKQKIVTMLEDFWCNNLPVKTAASRHGFNDSTASNHISSLFFKKLSDQTKIIVMQSKINDDSPFF